MEREKVRERAEAVTVEETGEYEPQRITIEFEETDHIWLVSEGDELDAVVTKIIHGKMKYLLPPHVFENPRYKGRLERIKERYGIKICFKVEGLGIEDCDVILYSFHENARYPKIAARYKELAKGSKIKVKATSRGRFRIV
jgi:hypothetical protein